MPDGDARCESCVGHTDSVFTPTRLAYAIKPHAPIPIMAAAVALAAMFAATPFLIPEIASRYGVSQGSAGFISVVQVGAFATSSFALPKVLAPSGRLLRIAATVFLLSNVASIFLSVFWLLSPCAWWLALRRASSPGSCGSKRWEIDGRCRRSLRSAR